MKDEAGDYWSGVPAGLTGVPYRQPLAVGTFEQRSLFRLVARDDVWDASSGVFAIQQVDCNNCFVFHNSLWMYVSGIFYGKTGSELYHHDGFIPHMDDYGYRFMPQVDGSFLIYNMYAGGIYVGEETERVLIGGNIQFWRLEYEG